MKKADDKAIATDSQRSDTGKPSGVKHVKSETLMGERKELVIEHAGREYILRITQNGKLILTA